MKKERYLPGPETELLLFMQNFSAKISTYATKYNITTAEVTDIKNGTLYFAYWLNFANQVRETSKKITAYKKQLLDGIKEGDAEAAVPTLPAPGTMPAAVPVGFLERLTSVIAIIKKRSNYSEADGNDLGIEGTVLGSKDLATLMPELRIVIATGGQPEIVWIKNGMSGIKIFVDRGDGNGFVWLASDTIPNYTDTHMLPPKGKPQVWTYKAIYLNGDDEFGQFSPEVSITVMSGL